MPLFLGFLLSLVTALFDLAGDVIIKSAADKARFISLATGASVLVYGFTAVCWYFTMRTISLGQGAVF